MAHMASDGSKYTNLPPMKAHQRSLDAKAGGKVDPLKMPGAGGGQEMGSEDPASVVAEHGPATEVHMMHDHEGGKHHVHSKHADGHETDSEHGSADEAHEHGKALASGGGEDEGGMMDGGEYE